MATKSDCQAAEKTEQAWWVYLLRCSDQSLYCGITTQLDKRLRQHNGEITGGARYTQSRRPCQLVYQERAENRQAALKREYHLKQLPKAAKERLVSINNSL
ncbi:GIY-YIG nuclease family protein [Thiomicrorhabdus sp. zzn3]|uniref:GIY-YIG nuclease family protein n=1 Tax=Thiomicrorhabdus sp. zzn3 TaxID=3039775 RepID=UPI0024363B10|nr:GIY-YIG nuclease family protein [Thiomicrorhabdus sp. zzn3]MDG6778658.1 GIY-YIG nuclease family protein [Thiomicrorhabdus sp. zzn3]